MNNKIVIVSDQSSWMRIYIDELAMRWRSAGHSVLVADSPQYDEADIVIFLSYSRIVPAEILSRARSNVVVHGSALPDGRGWSPWSWQILKGQNRLTLTLFEATEGVDSGRIYAQQDVELEGHELINEWQAKQARVTQELCDRFVQEFPEILSSGREQSGSPTYYPRRRPKDSKLDANLPIADQFNLLRIVDNDRYPAYFEYLGHTYVLQVRKQPNQAGGD